MFRKRKRFEVRFPFVFPVVLIFQFFFGCSNYKSFDKGEFGQLVEQNRLWAINLPYDSGEQMDIDRARDGELLVAESQDGYHLTKIIENRARSTKYLRLEYGDSHEWWDENQLLVIGDKKDTRYISLVVYNDLRLKYEKTYSIKKMWDFSIPGRKTEGNKIVFYNADFKIDRVISVVGDIQYSTPYIKTAMYNFYILDIEKGHFSTYNNISEASLGELRGFISQSHFNAIARINKKIDDFLFYIETVYLVDNNQTLVFTLTNQSQLKMHYAMNLNQGKSSIKQYSAIELSILYKDDLRVDYKDKGDNKPKDRNVTIGGTEYQIDNYAIFPDAFILLTRWVCSEETESWVLSVGENMRLKWEYRTAMPYYAGSLIEDKINNIVYVPAYSKEKKLYLQGLQTLNGRNQHGLPANFIVYKVEKKPFIKITGTYFDFKNRKLYIHHKKNNSIICANFPQRQ